MRKSHAVATVKLVPAKRQTLLKIAEGQITLQRCQIPPGTKPQNCPVIRIHL